METRKLQLTLLDLEDIRFALLIAAVECRDTKEDKLSNDLLKLHDRIAAHLEQYNIPERK